MAPLHRAVALEEVEHRAGGVGEHLHLDVAGVDDRLLEVEGRVAERGVRLALGRLERVAQGRRVVDAAHAAPTTAGDRLDEDGNPMASAAAASTSRSVVGSALVRVGRPASRAAAMARALLPARWSADAGGPMNVMPFAAHSARSGFSDMKP